jgi:glycosyltransferase involved in cell wall biosynthesis
MRSSPKVTIITPTYNRAKLLPETIESVLAQKYAGLEYYVIDDGSTDETSHIVQRYGGSVRYLYHQNRGEAETVNRGWELAAGTFVCVVSSDDPLRPNLIQRSVEAMEQHPNAIVSYPDWFLIDEQSKILSEFRTLDFDYKTMITSLLCLPGPGAFIRKAAVYPQLKQLRDPAYPLMSDFVCWWRLGLMGPFIHIPELLAQWRQHTGMTTVQKANSREMGESYLRLAHEFFARTDLPPEVRTWERASKGRAYTVAALCSVKDAPWYSLKSATVAFKYSPGAIRSIKPVLELLPVVGSMYRVVRSVYRLRHRLRPR